ncbi:hypothetical protein Tco_0716499 [Tanacetum coccineum]
MSRRARSTHLSRLYDEFTCREETWKRVAASWRWKLTKVACPGVCVVSLMLYPLRPNVSINDVDGKVEVFMSYEKQPRRHILSAQKDVVALGRFSDLAVAVNKISESVKNIEKNFDNALASTSNANDANNIARKPMDTKTDMKDQTDIMTKFLDEAEKADPQTSPSVNDVVERSEDQVETTSFDINDMQTASNLQKSEHEPNIKDKLLISSYETSEMLSDVVSQDDNENNAEVHIQKEHHTSSGSNLHDNADSTVEMEKVKKEMKAMEAALLGTARQA